ncbi:MAG: hypoxanthine phosphoribosyltransferase [Actinobacteria bacterium HGW-Actinobacteria-10]|jgi:hypoxanthine phosphoribosyltransferase|nr:MAG: hypoxanthine phosphoribosyltransferase [Actinobacteria bacterium HGW-Actinobacteria-10]
MADPTVPAGLLASTVVTTADITMRVGELGERIAHDYRGKDLRMVTILRGGLFFLSDLVRAVDRPVQVDFLAVSSYAGGTPGNVRITKDLDDPIQGASVLVVEDIIDTGLTLNYVLKNLRQRGPASLDVCTFLDKDVRRIVDLPIAYRGYEVPDEFLVGYGLDYRGRYRNLPYVAALDEAIFS